MYWNSTHHTCSPFEKLKFENIYMCQPLLDYIILREVSMLGFDSLMFTVIKSNKLVKDGQKHQSFGKVDDLSS